MHSNILPYLHPAYGRFSARGRRFEDGHLSDSDGRSMSPDTLASAKRPGSLSSRGLLAKGLAGPKLLKLSGLLPPTIDMKPGEKRPRPLTQHQLAVQEHRRRRVERQTHKLINSHYRRGRRSRYREGILRRTWLRIKDMPDPFAKSDDEVDLEHPIVRIDETEEEMLEKEARRKRAKYNNGTSLKGPAGLVPLDDEVDDFGEEAAGIAAALRRIRRRLPRWEEEERARKKRGLTGEEEKTPGGEVKKSGNGKRKRADNDEGSGSEGEFEDDVFEDARENNEDELEDEDATEEEEDMDDEEDMEMEDYEM